jgi:hypothetical protein
MIVEQMSSGGNFMKAHSPAAILSMAGKWWPAAFNSVAMDLFRGLLDEIAAGRSREEQQRVHRIRSRIWFGCWAPGDIETKILKTSEEPPPKPFVRTIITRGT